MSRVFQHDEDHACNISAQAALMDSIKQGMHPELMGAFLHTIQRRWCEEGLEMTCAGFLIGHEDFIGKITFNDCSKDLAQSVGSILSERILSFYDDAGGQALLKRLLGGRPQTDVMSWAQDLLRESCLHVLPIDQEMRRADICQQLSESWGFNVFVDRKSHKALVLAVTQKICEIESISDAAQKILIDVIDKAFENLSENLVLFSVVDHPIDLKGAVEMNKRYWSASFPLQETILSKNCSRRKRLRFLRMILEDINILQVSCVFNLPFSSSPELYKLSGNTVTVLE